MKTGFKISLSCALGAFVGALTALQLHPFFWWIGLVVGGSTGYLSFEWKAVAAAIPQAWSAATAWRPNLELWRARYALVMEMIGLLVTIAIAEVSLILFLAISAALVKGDETIASLLLGVAMMMQCMLCAGLIAGLIVGFWASNSQKANALREEVLFLGGMYLCDPFRFYGLRVPKFFFWTVPRAIQKRVACWFSQENQQKFRHNVNALYRFLKMSFRVIHSEVRLLCAVDAAIGSAIGYFVGSALVGAVVGAILGLVNYEVFSIRLLGLVPGNQSLFRR